MSQAAYTTGQRHHRERLVSVGHAGDVVTLIDGELDQACDDIDIVMELAQNAESKLAGPAAIEQYHQFHALFTRHHTHHDIVAARCRLPINNLQRIALLIRSMQ